VQNAPCALATRVPYFSTLRFHFGAEVDWPNASATLLLKVTICLACACLYPLAFLAAALGEL